MQLRPRWLVQESGQALIEYALILALTSLGIVSALLILQRSLGNTMQRTGRQIDAAAAGSAGQAFPGEPLGGETGAGGPAMGGDDDGDGYAGGHDNGKGNSGSGYGNGGPNGRK
jgi:Flp pilus assembly pilin Flp